MNANVIKSYLVSLQYAVDSPSQKNFDESLRVVTQQITKFTDGMATKFIEAGAAVVGVLTGIATGTLALMSETAKQDLGFQLLARRMYMTESAAKSMKISLDALGYSIEDIVWGPPELRERYKQLASDQRQLQAGLGGDFEGNMRRIRDVEFEFTRLKVEAQYFVMALVKSLSTALTGSEGGLIERLKGWNAWLIQNIPQLAEKFSKYLVPVLQDVKAIWLDIAEVGKDLTSILITLMGELFDDAQLKTGKVNIDNIGKSMKYVADETRMAADAIREIIDDLTTLNSIKVPWWLTPSGPYEHFWGKGTSQGAFFGTPVGPNVGHPANMQAPSGSDAVRAAIVAAARNMGVDPALALALADRESGMNPKEPRGALGEYGMMQVMPQTFQQFGKGDPANFNDNLNASMNYLRHLQDTYGGNEYRMAQAYNGGDRAVRRGTSEAYASDVMRREMSFSPTINIYASTNASPEEIARHAKEAVHSEYKKMAQREIVQTRAVGQYA